MTIKPNEERAKKAINLMKVVVAGTALMSLVHVYTIYFYTSTSLVSVSMDQLVTFGFIVGGVGLLFLAFYIVNIVFFIQWFRRAYFNLHIFFKSGLKYSEGMAAGAWFIPIFNLWAPYQIANDLCEKSAELLKQENHDPNRIKLKSTLNLWWIFWIASSFLSVIGNQFSKNELDVDLLITGEYFSLIATIVSMVSGIYCIKFIQKYSSVESQLAQLDDVSSSNFSNGNSDLLDA